MTFLQAIGLVLGITSLYFVASVALSYIIANAAITLQDSDHQPKR